MNVASPSSIFLRSVSRLPVTANVVPSSLILVALMIVGLRSFETLVVTRAKRHNNPEDGILDEAMHFAGFAGGEY
jgi:hypothetical protein